MYRATKLNGKVIEDAKENFTFSVTRQDCKKGKQKDPASCALAKGLCRKSGVVSVRIGGRIALVEYKNKVLRFSLKNEDQKKVRAFDAAKYFQPDEYELIPPKVPIGPKTRGHARHKPTGKHGGEPKTIYRSTPVRHALRVNGGGVI